MNVIGKPPPLLERWIEIEIAMIKSNNFLVTSLIEYEEYTDGFKPIVTRLLAKQGWKSLIEMGCGRLCDNCCDEITTGTLHSLQLLYSGEGLRKFINECGLTLSIVDTIITDLPPELRDYFDPVDRLNCSMEPITEIEDIEIIFERDDWKERLAIFLEPHAVSGAYASIKAAVTHNRPDVICWFFEHTEAVTRDTLEDVVTMKELETMMRRCHWNLACTIYEILRKQDMIQAVVYAASDRDNVNVLKRLLPLTSSETLQNLIDYNCSDAVTAWLTSL